MREGFFRGGGCAFGEASLDWELPAPGLFEAVVRDGFRLGGIELRGLVEVARGVARFERFGVGATEIELNLGQSSGGMEDGRPGGLTDVGEDSADGLGIGQERNEREGPPASGADQGEGREDPVVAVPVNPGRGKDGGETVQGPERSGARRRGGGEWASRGPGTISDQALEASAVGGLDTDRGVEAEPGRPSAFEDPGGVRPAHEPKASNPPPWRIEDDAVADRGQRRGGSRTTLSRIEPVESSFSSATSARAGTSHRTPPEVWE